ncbi:MAG TPA: nucleotide disphospho-sugar-binding domain-containing protein [Streptosporangiaceae bacterium]|jgi:UDP:flavonoid glycosyltransferase YjiC (YdhE family)|nr:nucleotide disphospho-sugar-binding domain-containing protein [Streptosporangiaceae bacterium]
MRVLFASNPVYSHFAPMIAPAAEAVRNTGHEVAVATGPSLAGHLDRLGLPHLPLPSMVTAMERAADSEAARRLGLVPEVMAKPVTGAAFGRLFAGEVSFVQQRLLLPACDLFITHAGFGSVRETLTAGVTTVALPQRADQPANAQRLAGLGFGITLARDEVDTAALTAACRRVLEDSSYRHAARGFQRQILGLPGIDGLVADLNALVG